MIGVESKLSHEVHMYAFGIAEDGSQMPANACQPLLEVAGYCVYVTLPKDGGNLEIVFEKDFPIQELAVLEADRQADLYECEVNIY